MGNIKFVEGNAVDALLNGEIDFLLNQVNCQNKYASGVAKEISEKIPEAKQAYHDLFNNPMKPKKLLGGVYACAGVIHLFGQDFYGRGGQRYTNYGALANSLSNVIWCVRDNVEYGDEWGTVIGIPDMIGCGLGGADREIVLELIEHLLSWAKEVRVYSL